MNEHEKEVVRGERAGSKSGGNVVIPDQARLLQDRIEPTCSHVKV